MPLDRASIKSGQRLRTRWITDLYDLLNGGITDTDVTLGRNLTVRGALSTVGSVSQVAPGPTNVPFTVIGAPGQSVDLFEVRDSASNLLFAVNAGGTLQPVRISDFSLALHNHTTNAQGGTLTPGAPATLEGVYATSWVATASNYSVSGNVAYVFCTAALVVTLPSAATTNRPISVVAVTGTATVTAVAGAVIGGSVNTSTGAVMDGTVSAGDSVTYKSDSSNWRAV
jgi:hypothetical protein